MFPQSFSSRAFSNPFMDQNNKSFTAVLEDDIIHEAGSQFYLSPSLKTKLVDECTRVISMVDRKQPAGSDCGNDPSVYTGALGHAYVYLKLAEMVSQATNNTSSSSTSSASTSHSSTSTTDPLSREAKDQHAERKAIGFSNDCSFNAERFYASAIKCRDVAFSLNGGSKKRITFVTGGAGLYAIAAALAASALPTRFSSQEDKSRAVEEVADDVKRLCKLASSALSSDVPDEILYGRAGYLWSLLWIQRRLAHSPLLQELNAPRIRTDTLEQLAGALAKNGRAASAAEQQAIRSMSSANTAATRNTAAAGAEDVVPPLLYYWHGKPYLGGAHGIAGIVFVLLCCADVLSARDLSDVLLTAEWLLKRARHPSGNAWSKYVRDPARELDEEPDRLVHWCHGATGFVAMALKAAEVTLRQTSSSSSSSSSSSTPSTATRAAWFMEQGFELAHVVWARGLLRKGMGLCHGVAGSGYVMLTVYRFLLSNEKRIVDADIKLAMPATPVADTVSGRGEKPAQVDVSHAAKAWLGRAVAVAKWGLQWNELTKAGEMNVPDAPWSLFEGCLGWVSFLADLIYDPASGGMPAYDEIAFQCGG